MYEIKTRNKKYVLIEVATDLVIAIANRARDLRALKSNLEAGCAFGGVTPNFFVTPPIEVSSVK